jgi:peptidyl-prolyl cis-trans isomerase C
MKALTIPTLLILTALAAISAQNPAPPPQTPAPIPAAPPRITPGTANPAPPPIDVPPDTVVLAIGSEKITRAQFEAFIAALPDQLKMAASGPQKRHFIEQYAELEALAQEARNRKLDQKPAVQKLIALQTDQVLAQQLYQDVAAGVKADDAAMLAYYDQHKADFEEIKARHILIRFKGSPVPARTGEKDLTEEEALAKAKDLREKIVKGADFAAIAKAESDDTGSGSNGGDLGSFGHGRMVKEFEQAALKLPIGEVSEPIKTQFGYHIIQVESRGTKNFNEVKAQIQAKLKPELTKKAVDQVKSQTTVTINSDYFGK